MRWTGYGHRDTDAFRGFAKDRIGERERAVVFTLTPTVAILFGSLFGCGRLENVKCVTYEDVRQDKRLSQYSYGTELEGMKHLFKKERRQQAKRSLPVQEGSLALPRGLTSRGISHRH